MKQYRFFKWDKNENLTFLGEEITEATLYPGIGFPFPDVDDIKKDWEVSVIYEANPSVIQKPNGKGYHPDPIVILRPVE